MADPEAEPARADGGEARLLPGGDPGLLVRRDLARGGGGAGDEGDEHGGVGGADLPVAGPLGDGEAVKFERADKDGRGGGAERRAEPLVAMLVAGEAGRDDR